MLSTIDPVYNNIINIENQPKIIREEIKQEPNIIREENKQETKILRKYNEQFYHNLTNYDIEKNTFML